MQDLLRSLGKARERNLFYGFEKKGIDLEADGESGIFWKFIKPRMPENIQLFEMGKDRQNPLGGGF